MKKYIFIALLLLVTSATFAQPQWFKATSASLKTLPNGIWSEWVDVDLTVVIDADKKHIEVLTTVPQVFDYVTLEAEKIEGGTVYGGLATDTNYKTVYIEVYIYDDSDLYLKITYSDVEYRYRLTE